MDELIYTSVPEGLATGSRGYCTVAQTPNIRKSLVGKLESLCNYKHVFAPGDPNEQLNPINFQFVRFRDAGKAKYVISRIGNAGFDYTQRTNFLAHNIALDRASLPKAGPVWFMNQYGSFVTQWDENRPPEYLAERQIDGDAQIAPAICEYWKSVTGDSGYGGWLAENLLDQKIPEVVIAYNLNSNILKLLEETFKLIPEASRWKCTFSTYSDSANAAYDCKLRCVLVGSPAALKASQSTKIAFLDLSKPFELRASTFVDLARTGIQQSTPTIEPESQTPVTEPVSEPVDDVTFVDSSLKSKPEPLGKTLSKEPQRWREIEEEEDWQEVVTRAGVSPLKKLVVALAATVVLAAGIMFAVKESTTPIAITSKATPPSELRSNNDGDAKNSESDRPQNSSDENRKKATSEMSGDESKSTATAPPKDSPETKKDLEDQLERLDKALEDLEKFNLRQGQYNYIPKDSTKLVDAARNGTNSGQLQSVVAKTIDNLGGSFETGIKQWMSDLSQVTIEENEPDCKFLPERKRDFYSTLKKDPSDEATILENVIYDIEQQFPIQKFIRHVNTIKSYEELTREGDSSKRYNETINQKMSKQVQQKQKDLTDALGEFEVKKPFEPSPGADIDELVEKKLEQFIKDNEVGEDTELTKCMKQIKVLFDQKENERTPFQVATDGVLENVLPQRLNYTTDGSSSSTERLMLMGAWDARKRGNFAKRFYSFDEKKEKHDSIDQPWAYCYFRDRFLIEYDGKKKKFTLDEDVNNWVCEFEVEGTAAKVMFELAAPDSVPSMVAEAFRITIKDTTKEATQEAQTVEARLVYLNPFEGQGNAEYKIGFAERLNSAKIIGAVALEPEGEEVGRARLKPGAKITLHITTITGFTDDPKVTFNPQKKTLPTEAIGSGRELETMDLLKSKEFPLTLINDYGSLYLKSTNDTWSPELTLVDVQRLASHYFVDDLSVQKTFDKPTFGAINKEPFRDAFQRDIDDGKIPKSIGDLREIWVNDLKAAFESSLGINTPKSILTGTMIVRDGYHQAFELAKAKLKMDMLKSMASNKQDTPVSYALRFTQRPDSFYGYLAPEEYKRIAKAFKTIIENHEKQKHKFEHGNTKFELTGGEMMATLNQMQNGSFLGKSDHLRAYSGKNSPAPRDAMEGLGKRILAWKKAYFDALNVEIKKLPQYRSKIMNNVEKMYKVDEVKKLNVQEAQKYAGDIMAKLNFLNKFRITVGGIRYKIKFPTQQLADR